MFTLLHPFAGFLLAAPVRKRLNTLAFFLGAMLPDLEGLYFIPIAYESCASLTGGAFAACSAEFPSHYLLHSFPGAILIGAGIVALFAAADKAKLLKQKISARLVFSSAALGALAHLFADLFFHGGADALALFYPMGWRPSLAFLGLQELWIFAAYAGIALFAYACYKDRKPGFWK